MPSLGVREGELGIIVYGAPHVLHVDPDLPLTDLLARARRPPRVIPGVLAMEAAAQIAAAGSVGVSAHISLGQASGPSQRSVASDSGYGRVQSEWRQRMTSQPPFPRVVTTQSIGEYHA